MNWLERLIFKKEVQIAIDQEIKESTMSPQLKAWLVGAANVVLSGAASALGSLAAHTTLKQGAVIVGCAVAMSFGKWFIQHPIPGGTQ